MILSTHFVVGASLGRAFPDPIFLLSLPILSHFILDHLPHWEYIDRIEQLKGKPFHLLLDVVLGPLTIFLTLYLLNDFSPEKIAPALVGGFLGVLPDGIVFLKYLFKIKNRLLKKYENFHRLLHSEKKLQSKVGIFQQLVIFLLAISLLIVAKTVELS